MFRRLPVGLAIAFALVSPGHAQQRGDGVILKPHLTTQVGQRASVRVAQNVIGGGVFGDIKVSGTCTPGSQASTFLARTSGLSGTETNAICTLINGWVADGVGCSSWGTGGVLDAIYIHALNTTTSANLNLCSTSFTLVQHGTVTFTPDVGYTGNGSTGYLDTTYIPSSSGGNYALNSALLGGYLLTNRTSTANYVLIGTANVAGTAYAYIQPFFTGSVASYELNGFTFLGSSVITTAKGSWLNTRTSPTRVDLYLNGSPFANSTVDNSVTRSDQSITILAFHDVSGVDDFSADQIAASYFGGGMNSTQVSSFEARLNTYMTTFGINVH